MVHKEVMERRFLRVWQDLVVIFPHKLPLLLDKFCMYMSVVKVNLRHWEVTMVEVMHV